jgi:hypothetical protein
MKFNRDNLEKLTLEKIKEVNEESGYRTYLEAPEMVNIVATIMEEKFKVILEAADRLLVYAQEIQATVKNQALYEVVCEDIKHYNNLKQL